MHVYVGTYTGGESKGIYLLELDPATGALTPPGLAAEIGQPVVPGDPPEPASSSTRSTRSASSRARRAGAVTAFAIDPDERRTDAAQPAAVGRGRTRAT